MTTNITSFGAVVTLRATNTFPIGVPLTQFADDTDPFDIPSMQVGDSSMGINGDLVIWSRANPIKLNLAFVPNSLEDQAMSVLLEANRVGKGKQGAKDIITINIVYPFGNFVTFTNGIITDGTPASSASNEGRLKSKTYAFAFENKIGV